MFSHFKFSLVTRSPLKMTTYQKITLWIGHTPVSPVTSTRASCTQNIKSISRSAYLASCLTHANNSYLSITDVGQDIIVTNFHMLSGDVILPGTNKFGFTLEMEGTSIPAIAAGPTVSPLKLSLYLSEDEHLSSDDYDLRYVMSAYTSKILSRGLLPGILYDIVELNGRFIRLDL